ncbi:MAG: phosphonates-binding protein [Acidobacteria bacterium]|nr:MAG: phosphonates-binding protein [Acidobacteriota bacterium]
MRSRHYFWLSLFLCLNLLNCVTKEAELGSKDNPIKMYFTPSSDAENISTNSRDFLEYLEKETGYFFESAIPTSYIAVVEAFGASRADIAVMNSFGYLLANQKYGAEAKLKAIRYGQTHYNGMIITRIDSGIDAIEDLAGKAIAFTDSSSTSGYLFPMKLLKEKNIEPSQTVFAMKHDSVVTMVYQGQVDAGACFYSPPDENGKIRDAREKVMTQFPDVEEQVKILVISDNIVNDPFVFRKGLPPELVDKVIQAITSFIASPEGKASFELTYNIEGVVATDDSDYDGLREMVRFNEIDPASMLEK